MPDSSTRDAAVLSNSRVPGWVWAATAGGVAATFVFDLLTPLGVAGGAPYVMVVLLGLWTRSRKFVVVLALVCIALTLLGIALSEPGLGGSVYLTNRGLTVAGIVICALLVAYQINLRQRFVASSRREREYLQVADVMLLALNAEGKITLLNRKGCEMLGCSEAEVRGKNWFEEFLPEEGREDVNLMFRQSMRANQPLPANFENEVVTRSGDTRKVRWHNLVLRDDQGQINGVLSSGEDVTEQEQREEDLTRTRHQLHAAEQMMAAVVETAVEGIITISTDGIIQTANKAAREMFGYAEDELTGQNVKVLMPSPDRDQHDGYLSKYKETGVAGIIGTGREVTAVKKDGTLFPIHLSVSDVRNHTVRLFTGVVRDLTEEKAMQRKLQEQEALAAIGQMAAVVAHEVKNPLAGIAGVIQVLRGRQEADTPEHQVMGDVLKRIDALVETLQDLLFYARPRELRLQPINVKELLQETTRLLEKDPRAAEVKMQVPDFNCTLHLDVDYMREALLNLYINAAQAMDGKGEIHTEVKDIDGFCSVKIKDTGPGIPEEVRHRVFEPFFTTKGRGTGLGLALVKRVVDRHGGELSIDCPDEGGTVVTLKLRHPPDETDE